MKSQHIAYFVSLLAVVLAWLSAPQLGHSAVPGKKPHQHHAHASKGKRAHTALRKLPVKSLYQLESKWMRQDGKKIKFSSFRGKIRVISMIYASCPQACPLTISDLKRLESAIPKKYRAKVGFVLVTFDPKRDTAKALRALAKKRKLDLKRWTLIRGDAGDVLELAAVLGVKFKKVSASDYAHSNLISILDPSGVLQHQQVGLRQDPTRSVKTLFKLLGIPFKKKLKKSKST